MAQQTFVTTHHSNEIGVMAALHYRAIYTEGLFFSWGVGIDWKAAIAHGVRIFVFKDTGIAEAPYTGTRTDLINLGRRFDFRLLEDRAFPVPFAGQRRFDDDELYAVDADDFHLAFGRDVWTSRFPRLK